MKFAEKEQLIIFLQDFFNLINFVIAVVVVKLFQTAKYFVLCNFAQNELLSEGPIFIY